METVNCHDHHGKPLQLAEQHSYQSILSRVMTTTTAPCSFLSFSDENVGPASSAFYLGIFYTMAIGEFNKIKTNVFKSSLTSMIMHAQWTTKTWSDILWKFSNIWRKINWWQLFCSGACHWLLSRRAFLNFSHRLLGGGQVCLRPGWNWLKMVFFPALTPPPGSEPGGLASSFAGQLFSSFQYHSHGTNTNTNTTLSSWSWSSLSCSSCSWLSWSWSSSSWLSWSWSSSSWLPWSWSPKLAGYLQLYLGQLSHQENRLF